MDGTTAFRVLGVSPGASKQTIKKAFRRLAQRAHPDVSGNAEAFVRLKDAYDVAYSSAPVDTGDSDTAERYFLATESLARPIASQSESLERRPVVRPGHARALRQRTPWLTSVLADFPATSSYGILVGTIARDIAQTSETSPLGQREVAFAEHLAKAMASAA